MSSSLDARQKAYRRGIWAERLAALLLMAKGYRVVARRFRAPGGEIDLVARRANRLAFVEVKARNQEAEALEAVTWRQRQRVEAAARAWLALHPADGEADLAFDIILVLPRRLPIHMCDAWRPGD